MCLSLFRFLFVRLFAPLYSKLLACIAYGPWGKRIHKIFIYFFKRIYKIEWDQSKSFSKLGDFFLRPLSFPVDASDLVSPVEALLMEGPEKISTKTIISVKGLEYSWENFPELQGENLEKMSFWNFYLAPQHYHWVHSPCNGSDVEAMRHSGLKYPVNRLGRKLCPKLYLENERLSFRWQHPVFGRVILLCIGAMGVSQILSELDPVQSERWALLSENVYKTQRLAGFRLGSSVLLVVEKAVHLVSPPEHLLPGMELAEPPKSS